MEAPDTSTNPPTILRDHSSLDTTSAESRIREAATMVGMTDEDRLGDILRRMDEEYVRHAWQLQSIEPSQWMALNVPIGVAAAIRQLSKLPQLSSATQSAGSHSAMSTSTTSLSAMSRASSPPSPPSQEARSVASAHSPARSVEQSLLELGSSTHSDPGAIFVDEDESPMEMSDADTELPPFPRLPGPISDVLGMPDLPPPAYATELYGMNPLDTLDEDADEDSTATDVDALRSVFPDLGPVVSPAEGSGPLSKRLRKRNAALTKALEIDSSSSIREKTPPRSTPYSSSPSTASISFHEEWSEVQVILRRLPIAEQRSLLCQLLIVENGATASTRAKLVENVIIKLREVFAEEEGPVSKDDLDLIIDHLRFFAGLRSEFRKKFGKVLFAALSELHLPMDEIRRGTDGGVRRSTEARISP